MERVPNHEQQQVIEELQENILLFASAGTGKTFTVARRIGHILASGKARPDQVLCVTFTIKACREMEEDISAVLPEQAKDIPVRTIHGFCLSFLREEALSQGRRAADLQVCDEVDQQELLLQILGEKGNLWQLQGSLKALTGSDSPEQLYGCDAVWSPELRSLCWVVETVKGPVLLSRDGRTGPVENARIGFEITCPGCGKKAFFQNTCPLCGHDLRQDPGAFETPLMEKNPGALRNLVSRVKHRRFERGLFTGDARTDYAPALEEVLSEEGDPFAFREGTDQGLRDFFTRHGAAFMAEYDRRLSQSGRLDYDDLIIGTALALRQEEVLSRWRDRFRYIVIDEMQDTSRLEYSALSPLFGENRVMLCGDFFQTIYEWRGSRPEEVLEAYRREYRPRVFMFRTNYRSTRTLANASFGYLLNTWPELMGKYCPPELDVQSGEAGELIRHAEFSDASGEAKAIWDFLRRHRDQDPASFCVMARSNRIISQLAERLDRINAAHPGEELSFFTVEKGVAFYKNPAVKDLLAFLRVVMGETDELSMERIALNFISRVGAQTLRQLREAGALGLSPCSFLQEDTFLLGDPYRRLMEGAASSQVVVFDTETTGLDLSHDQIMQLSAVRLDGQGQVIASFDQILIPTVPVSEGARNTVPYDPEEEIRKRGRPAEEVLAEFAAFARGGVLVGHNSAAFDLPLLQRELRDHGLPPLEASAAFDTLTLARQFYPGLENHKLSTLCEAFAITNPSAHNAMGDVLATALVLWHMLEQNVIPAREQREALVKKHAPRFEKFFLFRQQLRQLYAAGEVSGLFEGIISRCRLETVHKSAVSARAIRDVQRMAAGVKPEEAHAFLRDFVENAALSGSQMDGLIRKLRQIPIITVHQSKGCEFDTVILAGCDNFSFPVWGSAGTDREEEEKRVFYVAISRAKKKLILTNWVQEGPSPRTASPYIAQIPRQYVTHYPQDR